MSLLVLSVAMTLFAVFVVVHMFLGRRRSDVPNALAKAQQHLAREATDRPGTCLVPTDSVFPFTDEMLKEVASMEGYEFVAEHVKHTTRMLRFRPRARAGE